ncbi:hypothetical protein ACFSQE_11185 [Vogesella fluminis]|uniref:Uncharacterized protein n=1 Tax=Vogesella fluminis TaxID=1069161 RepID=A0ABQ3HB88_9NEIS|nr:hypothetical protein [Vogesella fluminis]GHD80144.1 hypothetical protein GCM10011419_24410 [Vogesella fluminis]
MHHLQRDEALAFIGVYQHFLETLRQPGGKESVLQNLAQARALFLEQPAMLGTYRTRHPQQPAEIIEAIASLRVKRWIYLRDTANYSIFLDPNGNAAYAVHGLTQRLREVTGGMTGCVITTGVFAWDGIFVCDGIVADLVWLGSNIKRDFSGRLKILRQQGQFFFCPWATGAWQ